MTTSLRPISRRRQAARWHTTATGAATRRADRRARGVAVDWLASWQANRAAVELVSFDRGRGFRGENGAWDVAFSRVDPGRAMKMISTQNYAREKGPSGFVRRAFTTLTMRSRGGATSGSARARPIFFKSN